MKRVSVNQKQDALSTDAMVSIHQYSIVQMQDNSNKIFNPVRTGIKCHETIHSETKQTRTSQTIDVTLIMKTKGSRRFQTTTNRMETKRY